MARANNGGWDFVQVGKEYQYKEDALIAIVKILEDNSTRKEYRFKVQVMKSNFNFKKHFANTTFNVTHIKDPGGYWNGMIQFYEHPEYVTDYPYNYRETTAMEEWKTNYEGNYTVEEI